MNFYVHAVLVTLLATPLLWVIVKGWVKNQYAIFFLYTFLTIALCPFVNLLIKKPIFTSLLFPAFALEADPKTWPFWFLPIALLVAPATEEAVKILPLVLPTLRRKLVEVGYAYGVGLTLGFGFGIGEAWYLAWGFSQKMPDLASGPLYELTGFLGERFLVVFVHAYFTAIVAHGISQQHGLRSYALAACFHALINVGAMLYQSGLISATLASVPLSISLLILFIYVFQLERRIRVQSPVDVKETVLFKRENHNTGRR